METLPKAWYQSTTVWMNIAFIGATVLAGLVPADFVAADWSGEVIILVQAAANIALRVFRTNGPIA